MHLNFFAGQSLLRVVLGAQLPLLAPARVRVIELVWGARPGG